MKKISIILHCLKCGGTERTAAELSNYFASIGIDVTIILLFKMDVFYQLDSRVNLIQPKLDRSKINKFLYILFIIPYLRNAIRKSNPDRIFILGFISYVLFVTLGMRYTFFISNRSNPNRKRFPMYRTLRNIIYKRAKGIIAQTTYSASIWKTEVKHKNVIVIPNFIRKIKDHNIVKENLIANVGRLTFEKGQHYLMEAFAKLQAPEWKLIFIGDGPLHEKLTEKAIQLNILERVVFAGFQKDVDSFLHKSKIFAFSSIIEGFPNALCEAMATPLPCVSFDCVAGPSEIISDGINGFLVPTGNIEQLSDVLSKLIESEPLRKQIAKEAYKVRKLYNIEDIGNRYYEFIFN